MLNRTLEQSEWVLGCLQAFTSIITLTTQVAQTVTWKLSIQVAVTRMPQPPVT